MSGIDNKDLVKVTCICGSVWLLIVGSTFNCPNCTIKLSADVTETWEEKIELFKPMIDKEEYQNVIRAAYSLCQQIYDMELAGAITHINISIGDLRYRGSTPISDIDEILEERQLLYALLAAKQQFPLTFLEGCKNASTTPAFIKEYSTFIPNNPSQT